MQHKPPTDITDLRTQSALRLLAAYEKFRRTYAQACDLEAELDEALERRVPSPLAYGTLPSVGDLERALRSVLRLIAESMEAGTLAPGPPTQTNKRSAK